MKTAIITGGGGGIGQAIAEALRADGFSLGLLDLESERLHETAAALGATPLVADVTDEAAVAAAVAAFGPVPDVLVNNAGIGRFAPLLDLSLADFRDVLEVNLVGAYVVARAVARGMIARGSGRIINITSVGGIAAAPGAGSYGAAKSGLARLTEQMALEWGPEGVRVNAVAPGFVDAGLAARFYEDPEIRALRGGAVPSRRLGTAEDVAGVVAFLASESADYINGEQIVVDGGLSVSVLTQLPRAKSDP